MDRYRRTQGGFVWQQVARNLIPYLSARANIELPMTISGVSPWEKHKETNQSASPLPGNGGGISARSKGNRA